MRRLLPLASLLLVLSSGGSRTNEEALWQHRNLGKAYFEDPVGGDKSVEEFAKALALAPQSFREQLNYGLALMKAGRPKEAIEQLLIARKLQPNLPHTWFNLGIAYKRIGRQKEAIGQFERMVQLVPDEPVSHYNLGLLYSREGREGEALREFHTAARLNPRLVAPKFQIYNAHRLAEREQEASKALAEFTKARSAMKAADEDEDLEWSFYSEIYDVIEPLGQPADGSPALRFEDRTLPGKADPKAAAVLVFDFGGDAKPDLLVWSKQRVALYRNGLTRVNDPALASLSGVTSVAAGDYNNDGFVDLAVVGTRGVRLLQQQQGKFAPVALPQAPGTFTQSVWLDYDHDYDLDLFLLGRSSVLLRNKGEGGFDRRQFPFVAGDAQEALPFRLISDTKAADLLVTYRDREAVLYRDRFRGEYTTGSAPLPAGTRSLTSGDINQDGWMDVVSSSGSLMNRAGKLEPHRVEVSAPYCLADVANRGAQDLITAGRIARNAGLGKFAPLQPVAGLGRAVALDCADFNGDGTIDVAGVAPDGSLHLWINRTASNNQWLAVSLSGLKNLKTAPGTEVEVKAGSTYQKKNYEGVPLVFGLGNQAAIDTLRITWANGNIQNLVHPPLRQISSIKESPRLSGSCPMIFTWNGREFQFITDVLGVAPLGAGSGNGEVFPVDHDEYVQIPGSALVARGGDYEIRISEELREVSYIDQLELIALDHPAQVEIFTNEKFKSPPFPEFRLYGVERRIAPGKAHDDRGRDVTERLLHRDAQYVDTFRRDAGGVAETHTLELDFGRAPRNNPALLVLNGWVDWADGSTFVGASQSRPLQFPILQVIDSKGNWQTVIPDMGIPAGKPKTMVVDLTRKFLSPSRKVRIVTNLCVYWDEIFLSEETAVPTARLTPLEAAEARLRFRGFSKAVIHPRRLQPESFVYGKLVSAPWDPVPGHYTRYGDVRGLSVDADDRLVVFGSGDEMALRFSPRMLPPLPLGWQRDFLLLVDGWAKDSDANTAYAHSVEPLPFHGMSGYPYAANERSPASLKYNTRPARKLMERLAP